MLFPRYVITGSADGILDLISATVALSMKILSEISSDSPVLRDLLAVRPISEGIRCLVRASLNEDTG